MIESWTVSENESVKDIINFNPVIPNYSRNDINKNNEPTKNDYIKYGWLFGKA